MPSNSEMYDQGSRDAEANDLQPFYYQHYFYYRKGYNETRRRLRGDVLSLGGGGRRVWLVALFFGLLLGAAAYIWLMPGQPAAALVPTVPLPVVPSEPPAATNRPLPTPTATAMPTPTPGLVAGGSAQVINLGESTLRVRTEPSLDAPIRLRLEEGSEVRLLEGPVVVDGLAWWRIASDAGEGWSAAAVDETEFLIPLP
jgi:hypothetical protein